MESLSGKMFQNPFTDRLQRKGKSGGARVITLVKFEKERVVLLTVFDKSEEAIIDEKYLKDLLNQAD